MTLRVVKNKNNPSRNALNAAYEGWSSVWSRAAKVEFHLMGGERLYMSVIRLTDEEGGLTIKGFLESGEGVEVSMNSMTETGTAIILPKTSYSFIQT